MHWPLTSNSWQLTNASWSRLNFLVNKVFDLFIDKCLLFDQYQLHNFQFRWTNYLFVSVAIYYLINHSKTLNHNSSKIHILILTLKKVALNSISGITILTLCATCYPIWDHPFKTSTFLRGGGVKNWPNLPTDSSKKLKWSEKWSEQWSEQFSEVAISEKLPKFSDFFFIAF